jgi:DNA-binding MarR family transcriptional regulator
VTSVVPETPMSTIEDSAALMAPVATDDDVLCAAELSAWRGLLRVHACVMKRLDAALEEAHGLQLTSFEVLTQLAEAPQQRMRMCDLADSVMLSRSGMSRLADRLEREGLLQRCACTADARGQYACLTPGGLELLEAARPTHLAGVRAAFLAQFEEDELQTLGQYWQRLLPA